MLRMSLGERSLVLVGEVDLLFNCDGAGAGAAAAVGEDATGSVAVEMYRGRS